MSKKYSLAPVTTGSSELELVPGIGPKTADALRSAGIATLEALVDSSPTELSRLLGLQGVRIAAERIADQDWLTQAARMLREATTSAVSSPPGAREVASFTVWFELDGTGLPLTRLYDNTTDEEGVVEGHERAIWSSWIQRRVDGQLHRASGAADGGLSNGLVIGEVAPVRAADGILEGLRLVVSFSVLDPPTAEGETTPYRVEAHLVERDTGNTVLFKDCKGVLVGGVTEYSTVLVFPVPANGAYQMFSALRIGDREPVTSDGPSFTLQ